MPVDFQMESPPDQGVDPAQVQPDLNDEGGFEELAALMGGDLPSPDAEDSTDEDASEGRTAAPATPAKPQGPSADELQRQLAEVNDRYAKLEERFHNTQQWGNQANMVRSAAEALLQAQQQKDWIQEQLRQRHAQAQPPEIDFGDPDDLLADPKKLVSALQRIGREHGEWAYKRAVNELMPHLSQTSATLNLMQQAQPVVEDFVREKAKQALISGGELEASQADEILEIAYRDVINVDPHAAAYRLRPDAVIFAANYVRQQRGAPIKAKPKPAASAGSGDPKASATATARRGKPTLSPREQQYQKLVEKSLGVQFDDNDLAKLAARR